MDQVIVIKKPDLGVKIIFPNPEKFGPGLIDIVDCPTLKQYADHDWFLMNRLDCALIRRHPLRESRKQLYHNGNTIQIDFDWKVRLMPVACIRKRHINRCNAKIDAELDKENPDQIQIARALRAKEKCRDWTEKQWYEQAKQYIEEEKVNKPIILEKLNAKITELSNRAS